MSYKIAVCVKAVPNSDQYAKIQLDPVKKTVVREGIEQVLNKADLHAIELAVQLKEKHGGSISLITMGPPAAAAQLREGLAYGCDDAWLISDRRFGGADSLATSYTLAKAIEHIGAFDLILLGNVSEDGATAHVPSQLGELLGVPHVTDVVGFEVVDEYRVAVKKPVTGGIAEYEVALPALLGVDRRLNAPRHPNVMGIFGAKNKPLTTLGFDDMPGMDETKLGLGGSPTVAGDYRDVSYARECAVIESVEELAAIIRREAGL